MRAGNKRWPFAALVPLTALVVTTASAATSVHRSSQTQVSVFAVGSSAVLTIIADSGADSERIDRIGDEVGLD